MPDFEDYTTVSSLLESAQDADTDNRENSRESHDFVDKRDGQWEPTVSANFKDRPRYTLDKTNPIVNQISGRIKQADFGIKVKPAGGEATKDTAELLDGMIRNIQNISNASKVYGAAAKSMITGGIDGWMVVQDWADTDAFEQDLFIKPVPNFVDSVWFDTNSQEQDRSDSQYAFKLTSMAKDAYDEKYPDGSGRSVGQDRQSESYFNKPENVVVGEFFYIKKVNKDIIRMNSGQVFADEKEFNKVKDELAAQGIVEQDRRTRKSNQVWIRQFDGDDWLKDAVKTVFNWIPLIPTYGNFKVTDSKIIYRGVVDKLIDPQRIYNYARSRQIEEGALSPRDKIFMTRLEIGADIDTIQTMNTNTDPVQPWTPDPDNPRGGPFKIGASVINAGLAETAQSANQDITQASGLFASNMGENPGLQSGVAIDSLKEAGDTGTIDYFESQEIAICHTARILIDAIPKVYDTERQIRIINEDGSFDMQTINEQRTMIQDGQTGTIVKLNDLSKGRYDVTCDVGKTFKSRQEESVAAIIEMAQIDPTIIQEGGDILLANSNAPGLNKIGERKRRALFEAGRIPPEQWTEEEQQQVQEAQQQQQGQEQQPDPMMVAAQAEVQKAQAEQMNAQNKQVEIQGNQQVSMAQLELDNKKIDLETQKFIRAGDDKFNVDAAKIDQSQQALDLKAQKQQLDAVMQAQQLQQQEINDAINNLKVLREAMGVDAIVGPTNTQAYKNQADEVIDEQKDQ